MLNRFNFYINYPILFSLPILHFLLCTGTFPCSRSHYHRYKWGIICWFLLRVPSKVRSHNWRVLLSSEFRMVGFYIFYKVCFKTSVKVKKVTKTMDFINSAQTLVCFHIHHKNSSLFLMHDLEKIKNLNRDRRKLEFQLVLWASSSHILLSQGHFLLVLGAVHTWCSETSAWVPTQTGVAFTPWAPDMQLCA